VIAVFNSITIEKNRAKDTGLPLDKVERVELFGGLTYVNHDYFLLVLRMEYVFMNMFTAEKLVMMGSDLISNVYSKLSSNQNVKELVCLFTGGCSDAVNNDTWHKLVCQYCQMRGKDFVRK